MMSYIVLTVTVMLIMVSSYLGYCMAQEDVQRGCNEDRSFSVGETLFICEAEAYY